jgi:DNA-binding CsgD family transcriptional regulator
MRFNKALPITYDGYLHDLCSSHQAIDKSQIKDVVNYYKERAYLFKETTNLFFAIDYTQMRYLFFSESCKQVTGYDAMQFLNDGLTFTISLMDHDYWNVYNHKIFPAITQILKGYPLYETSNLRFSYNLRLQAANRKWINLLQNNRYITSQTTGLPLYCLGMITDITDLKADKLMNFKVEWINQQTGQFKPIEQKLFYVNEEDKLLSKNEKIILNYIAEGLSSKMIADKLKISEYTIDNHRQNMLNKTETNNVAHLVAFSIKNGII